MFMVPTNNAKLSSSDIFRKRIYKIFSTYSVILLILELIVPSTTWWYIVSFFVNLPPLILIYVSWQQQIGQMVATVIDPKTNKKVIMNKDVYSFIIVYRIFCTAFLVWKGLTHLYFILPLIGLELIFCIAMFFMNELFAKHVDLLDAGFAIKLKHPENYEYGHVTQELIDEEMGIVFKKENTRSLR